MNEEILKDLGKRTDITGVSSGTKVKNGVDTGEPCVVIYVPKKKPLSELTAKDILPKRIDGKIIDVQEEIFTALGMVQTRTRPRVAWEDGGPHTGKYRPAVGGTSVGHYSITAGTLGTAVYLNNVRIFLSNNHVLANCNDASIGDDIYQPGPYDGGTVDDKLGELLDFIPVVPEAGGGTNEVDAAIGLPTNESDLSMEIADLTPFVRNAKNCTAGMVVTKSGRTTGVKVATVASVDASIRVQYPSFICLFVNQILINTSEFVQGGDSGSACLEQPDFGVPQTLVGLVFAGSQTTSICCPIAPIFDKWELKFTTIATLRGIVKHNGHIVAGAKVLAFNLSTMESELEFMGYAETDSGGNYVFTNSLYKYETAIVFANYQLGVTEYNGFRKIECTQDINYANIDLHEYTPLPSGLFCKFKLPGDFLVCDLVAERYYSNLY